MPTERENYIRSRLEPDGIDRSKGAPFEPVYEYVVTSSEAQISQAISLKRIADALELLAKPDPLADLNWQDWTPTEDQPKPLIPPGLQVAICARGGWKAAISLERTAALDWSHANNPGDIVAYAIMPG